MLLVSTRNHPEGWGSRVSAVGCGPIRSPTPGRLAGAPRAPFSPGFGGNVRLLIVPRISWAAASRSSPQLTAFHGKVRDVPVVVRTRVKMTFSVTGGRFSSALEKTVTPPTLKDCRFVGEGIFTGQVLRLGRRRSAWPLVGDGVLARRAAAELGVSAGMGTSRAAPRAPWAYSPGSPAGTPRARPRGDSRGPSGGQPGPVGD